MTVTGKDARRIIAKSDNVVCNQLSNQAVRSVCSSIDLSLSSVSVHRSAGWSVDPDRRLVETEQINQPTDLLIDGLTAGQPDRQTDRQISYQITNGAFGLGSYAACMFSCNCHLNTWTRCTSRLLDVVPLYE